jgi:hypothetical protein
MKRYAAVLSLVLACVLVPAAVRAAILDVDQADDVCAPDADPCVINQTIYTVPNAVLDFGTRELQITSGGLIDADRFNVTVLAGDINVSVSGVGIKLRGVANAYAEGGVGRFVARRRCSGDTTLICRTDTTCAAAGAGTCSVGTGNVVIDGRINGTADDPASVTIEAAGDIWVKRVITTNATYLDSDGGDIELDAVGSVTLDAKLQSTAGSDGTGGDICVLAGGDITVNAVIDADGGDFDGGFVELDADGDLVVYQDITANAVSGEGFGGEIDLSAGNDLKLIGGGSANRQLLSTVGNQSGEGYGGDGGPQCLFAGRDVVVGEFVRALLSGAAPDGYGEAFEVDADRDIDFEADVVSVSQGQFGAGGDFSLSAGNDAVFGATASVSLVGSQGGAGEADLDAERNLTLDGSIDVTASSEGPAGSVYVDVGRTMTMSGSIVADGAASAADISDVDMSACQMTFVSGASVDDASPGARITLSIGATLQTDVGSELLATDGGSSTIMLSTSAAMPVLNGVVDPVPAITTNPLVPECHCGNGIVDPQETCDDGNEISGDGCDDNCQDEGCIAQTPSYPDVPLCSDGNPCTDDVCHGTTDGTGTCSHTANTSPCDDGLYCTAVDTCSLGACVGVGDPCTGLPFCASECDEQSDECASPSGTPCTSDGNPCTDNQCDGAGACVAVPNTDLCDDGLFCTTTDVCQGGECVGSGDPCVGGAQCEATCDESADACLDAVGVGCDDGDPCTVDDQCDGAGTCSGTPMDCSSLDGTCVVGRCDATSGSCVAETVDDGTACDDGMFCTATDTCMGGTCVGSGDPCAGGSQCGNSCDEEADSCGVPIGTSCDDGDACTLDDVCDELGGCSGTPKDCSGLDGTCMVGVCEAPSGVCVAQPAADDTPCDDGDDCTSDDVCSGGQCAGTAIAACGCGDGVVEPPEQCDDGDNTYVNGDYCRADCTLVGCGDPVDQGRVTASAALFILKAAVGAVTCSPCVCSVDGNQSISAVDSLTVLKRAVGQSISLQCPSCTMATVAAR